MFQSPDTKKNSDIRSWIFSYFIEYASLRLDFYCVYLKNQGWIVTHILTKLLLFIIMKRIQMLCRLLKFRLLDISPEEKMLF